MEGGGASKTFSAPRRRFLMEIGSEIDWPPQTRRTWDSGGSAGEARKAAEKSLARQQGGGVVSEQKAGGGEKARREAGQNRNPEKGKQITKGIWPQSRDKVKRKHRPSAPWQQLR